MNLTLYWTRFSRIRNKFKKKNHQNLLHLRVKKKKLIISLDFLKDKLNFSNCKKSKFGCCEDGKMIKQNIYGSNCPMKVNALLGTSDE